MRAFPLCGGHLAGGAPLATFGFRMTHRPFQLLLISVVLMAIGSPMAVRASTDDEPFPRIRPTEPRLRALVTDAARSSPTVRSLIARISASDLVVFIHCERDPAIRTAGRLNFLTTAGGVRYVLIRLKRNLPRHTAIALLAHELQHAAEIADTPAIVDEPSMGRAYERMGDWRSYGGPSVTFDTKSAVDVGERVRGELSVKAD